MTSIASMARTVFDMAWLGLFDAFDAAQRGFDRRLTHGAVDPLIFCCRHNNPPAARLSKQHVTSNFSRTTRETKLLPTCSLTHLLFARRLRGLSMGMERGIWWVYCMQPHAASWWIHFICTFVHVDRRPFNCLQTIWPDSGESEEQLVWLDLACFSLCVQVRPLHRVGVILLCFQVVSISLHVAVQLLLADNSWEMMCFEASSTLVTLYAVHRWASDTLISSWMCQ